MSETSYQAGSAPQSPLPQRRFTAGTVLIPAAFIVLHFIAAMLASFIFLFAYLIFQGSFASGSWLDILTNETLLNQLMTDFYPIVAVIYSAALIPVYLVYLMVRRNRDPRVLMVGKPRPGQIFLALAIIIGALGVTNLWMALLNEIAKSVPAVQSALDEYAQLAESFTPATGLIWLFLGISVMAPLTEELLFRGIVQGELRKAMPDWAAIVCQALIFAAYHMQAVQISYVILPGLLLGFAYYWTRSIWVPIIMHIGFNFAGSFLPAVIGENELAINVLAWVEFAFIIIGTLSAIYLYRTRSRVVKPV